MTLYRENATEKEARQWLQENSPNIKIVEWQAGPYSLSSKNNLTIFIDTNRDNLDFYYDFDHLKRSIIMKNDYPELMKTEFGVPEFKGLPDKRLEKYQTLNNKEEIEKYNKKLKIFFKKEKLI